MSNLFKSKFFLGVMVVAFVVVGALGVNSQKASAASCSTFTMTLKYGMRNSQVLCLQQMLNEKGYNVDGIGAGSAGKETTYFGNATKASVKTFQAAHGLVADAIFGPNSRAALVGAAMSSGYPDGCTSSTGFSSTTGAPCNTGVPTNTTYPAGCTSAVGFSSTTGLSCAGGTTTQNGPVTVSLSTDNPASGVIVAGQATADLAHFTFTGNGTVNSVSLKRSGISDQNTLTNVYLYDGVQRLTDGYSFNSNGDIVINNLGLVVNGSKTISVKADVYSGTSSGQTVAVWLTSFTAGTSVTAVNLGGNMMSVAAGSTLGSIGISGSNQVTAATVNAGTSSYAVWRQALQVNTRTLWLKAANFRVTGSAQSDALGNVSLYVDGVKAGNNATMTVTNGSNYMTFDMTAAPVALTTGSHTFEVRADIVKGSSYNVTVSLQQASDLMVTDPQVGVNVAICGSTSFISGVCQTTYAASTAGTISIGSGSVTVVIDPAFNSITNVTGGASNIAIAKFKLHGYGEDVKVTSITATPVLSGTTPAASGLQNVTLFFNGSQVGSQQSWTSGALTFNLGSQMIVPAGVDSFLEVRADLRTSAGVNYTAGTVSANLGSGTAEGWNSKASITTSAQTGNSLTIQTGLLAVAKNTGYANQTQNPNTSGVKIGSYVLQNQSSSESVRVTSLTVGLTTDGTTVMTNLTTPALTNFGGLKTSETTGSGSTPVQPQGSNVFSVDFTLAPGATKIVDIFADTSSSTGAVVTTMAVTGLGASSNTSITVAAVQGQTITLSSGTVATPTLITASATSAQYIAAGDPNNTGMGAVDATKASYTFVSTGGASTISELKFTVTGTNTVMSVKVGSTSAPVVSGVAWLQGLNIAVPNGGSGATVDAYITYAPVGTSGVTPSTTSITALGYIKYSSGGTTSTICTAALGSCGTVIGVGGVVAPTMTMVGSKPTVAVNTTVNTGLNLGAENKIGEVTVSADAKGSIKINDIQFAVGNSNFTTLPTFTLARIADGTTTIAGTSCGQGVAAASSQTIFCEFGTTGDVFASGTTIVNTEVNTDFDGYTIAAGTSKTFSLYATVSAANTGTGSATISSSVNAAGFNWDDTSTNGASGTALTGSLIYNFPSGSYSIKQ